MFARAFDDATSHGKRLAGVVACVSLRVREVPGSIPGAAHGQRFERARAPRAQKRTHRHATPGPNARSSTSATASKPATVSLAQLAEHALRKRMVTGSIPIGGFSFTIDRVHLPLTRFTAHWAPPHASMV